MSWHYVEQGQQIGPVSDEQFSELVRTGQIKAETLVWREGMANWSPYEKIQTGQQPISPVATGEPTEAVCSECGGVFPIDDTIRYGNVRVCANCKPIFMQKLAEGAQLNTGEMRYAGFWIRFGAKFIDGLVVRAVATPAGFLMGFLIKPSTPSGLIALQITAGAIGFLLTMGYTVFLTGKYGATLGKMACKVKIVTADGAPISYKRAFGRFFAEMLSGCPTLLIGYIMAGVDEQKRALHDRLCNTRVIHK